MSRVIEQYRSAVLTTANQLTILRIVVVPVFIILLAYREIGWALGTFVAAGITDVLDGIIARRFRQKTSIGAVIHPASVSSSDGVHERHSAVADDTHHLPRRLYSPRFFDRCADGRLARFHA